MRASNLDHQEEAAQIEAVHLSILRKSEREAEMKSPIVFRASFQGPIGPLNPSGWKFPGPIWVEVFHQKIGPPAQWAARRPGTTDALFEITPQNTADILKKQIAGLYFEERLTAWVAYDLSSGKPVELLDDEWSTDSQGKVFISEIRKRRLSEKAIQLADGELLPAQPEKQKKEIS